MTKHVFFDLDNTITRSRTEIAIEHKAIFERLCKERDVIIVSGAEEFQIRAQITPVFDGFYYILAQRGNHSVDKQGKTLWRETLSPEQLEVVHEFIEKIKRELSIEVRDENDLIEDRGSQVGYSILGHHEDVDKKEAYDPGSIRRIALIKQHADDLKRLRESGIAVEPGGSTSIDFFLAGKDKGYNITRLLKELSWSKEDCIYVGDELEPGRNDESVLGVIPTHAIKNPNEAFDFIANELLS